MKQETVSFGDTVHSVALHFGISDEECRLIIEAPFILLKDYVIPEKKNMGWVGLGRFYHWSNTQEYKDRNGHKTDISRMEESDSGRE